MANDVIINGETYSGVESVALANSDGSTTQYYADAVRYVSQTLTDEQKAQARANIGIEDADNVLVVTMENDVASHTPAEIEAAIDAKKAVFLDFDGTMVPVYEHSSSSVTFVFNELNSDEGKFLTGTWSVAADKKITTTFESYKVPDAINSAIQELKNSGELGGNDILVVTASSNVASHSPDEIKAAVDAGKVVFLIKAGIVYNYALYFSGTVEFQYTYVDHESGTITFYQNTVNADKSFTFSSKSMPISVYSKTEIDAIMGSYINDIDTLIGGDG